MKAVIARFLFLLGLGVWLGGYAFFGAVAAPMMFRVARENSAPTLAPLMVGEILSRFAFVSTVCAFLMLAGWLLSRGFSAPKSWKWQGVFTVCAVAVSLFSNLVLLPQTRAAQPQILSFIEKRARGEALSSGELGVQTAFDARHKLSENLGRATIWMLLLALGAFCAAQNAKLAGAKTARKS